MKTPIERINRFAATLKLATSRGKCPIDKLFMMERCNYGDLLEVKLPFVNDDFIADQDLVYTLKIEVMVLAGKPDYCTTWGWEPKEYMKGTVMFYHQDHEAMLESAAEWLEARIDPVAAPYIYKRSGEYELTPLKCEAIGRIKHYTTTPGFEAGNLERNRGY